MRKPKESQEQEVEEKKAASFSDFLKNLVIIKDNKTCRATMIAGALRAFGNMIVSAYLPVYFSKVFPEYQSTYSILSAAALLVCGLSSVLLGGAIGDRYSKKEPRTNAFICMGSAIAAIPAVTLCCLLQNNFWLSMAMCSLTIFVSGSYYSPAITMMQNSDSIT